MRIAQRERVEPRAEYDDLSHAARHTGRHRLFREAAARSDEETHRPVRGVISHPGQTCARLIIKDLHCIGIGEDDAAF